jgi:hypothetical protein
MSDTETPVPAAEPTEPYVVGEVSLSEMRTLEQLRATSDNLVREIGNLEVRKASLLVQLQQVNQQAQTTLNAAAHRLGIPPGETWQVTSDGKVLRNPPK